tara:strand:- start:2227 stop:2376 length:150 start_codon:yes stop_codon:yes gene_type:complete
VLGELIIRLKYLVHILPSNLYELSSRQETVLQEIIKIIQELEAPDEDSE